MIKKISIPNALLIVLSLLAVIASVAMAEYLSERSVLWMCPVFIAAFVAGYRDNTSYAAFLILTLPLTGLGGYFMKLNVIPFFLPVYWCGFLGLSTGARRRGEKWQEYHVNLFLLLFVLVTLLSFLHAILTFVPFMPDWHATVLRAPWGVVYLKNALGWVLLAGLTYALAFRVYLYAITFPFAQYSDNIIHWLMISMAIPFLLGLLQYAGAANATINHNFIGQYNASFSDPNSLGLYAAMMFPFLIAVISRSRMGWAWLPLGAGLLFLIFIAASRSAFLLLGGALVLSVLFGAWQKKRIPWAIIGFVLLLSSLLYVKQNKIQQEYSRNHDSFMQIKRALHSGDLFSLIGDRKLLWRAGMVTMKHNRFLGTGLGTYLIRMPTYENEIGILTNDNCGQMFLHIGAEMGVFALIVFVLLLITSLWRAFPADGPVLLSLCGLLPTFMVGAHLLSFEINILFWFMLGLLSSTKMGIHEYL